jgi:hypothetical protein
VAQGEMHVIGYPGHTPAATPSPNYSLARAVSVIAVVAWDEQKRWVGPGAWSRSTFVDSLGRCTSLRGAELKRLARRLLSQELMEFDISSPEEAAHAAHILESLGASIEIRYTI